MHTLSIRVQEKFSPLLFLMVIGTTFAVVLGLMILVVPDNVWYSQWNGVWYKYLNTFLVVQLISCFVEWAFHRYMLHRYVFPGFKRLFIQHHMVHHADNTPIKPDSGIWDNDYPITRPDQYKASFFPWYAYSGFIIFATPFAVIGQWLFPEYPVLLVTLVSVGWSLTFYEFLHAIEHLPMAQWNKVLRRTGSLGRAVYAFHQGHHVLKWMKHHNMAISGFVFGIPIADLVLGTFRLPKGVLDDGSAVVDTDKEAHRPWLVVRILDRLADGIVSLRKAALGG